jgi:hypothetical protein
MTAEKDHEVGLINKDTSFRKSTGGMLRRGGPGGSPHGSPKSSTSPSRSRSNSFAVSEQSIPHSIQDVEKSYVSTFVSALFVTLNSKYHQSLLCIDFHDAIIFLIGLPKQFEGEVSPSENHIPERFQRRAKKSAQVVTCSHEPSQPRFFRRVASEYAFFINHFPCLLRRTTLRITIYLYTIYNRAFIFTHQFQIHFIA